MFRFAVRSLTAATATTGGPRLACRSFRFHRRPIAAGGSAPISFALASFATATPPIVELREYDLHPSAAAEYLKLTTDSSDLRKTLTPLRIFTVPETGGKLHVATHFYYYAGGHAERDARRGDMARNEDWASYLSKARGCMKSQRSAIFVEAPLVGDMDGVQGLAAADGTSRSESSSGGGGSCIFELRRYQLQLGYDTVPEFLRLYGSGLPSKLNAAGTDPSTSLITLLYSDVGNLNEVIEVWKHGGGTEAMERSRVAARASSKWRDAIAGIAGLALEFNSTIHKPLSFSPLR